MNTDRAIEIVTKHLKLVKRMNINHGDIIETMEIILHTLDCYREKEKK